MSSRTLNILGRARLGLALTPPRFPFACTASPRAASAYDVSTLPKEESRMGVYAVDTVQLPKCASHRLATHV